MARALIYTPDPSYRYIITWNGGSSTNASLYGSMIEADQLAFDGYENVEVYMEENTDD